MLEPVKGTEKSSIQLQFVPFTEEEETGKVVSQAFACCQLWYNIPKPIFWLNATKRTIATRFDNSLLFRMGDKVSKDDDNFVCGPFFSQNSMSLRKELIVLESLFQASLDTIFISLFGYGYTKRDEGNIKNRPLTHSWENEIVKNIRPSGVHSNDYVTYFLTSCHVLSVN